MMDDTVAPASQHADAGQPIAHALPTAPIPRGVIVPDTYRIGAGGLWQVAREQGEDGGWREKATHIAPSPIVISRVGADVETDQRTIRLAWLEWPEWRSITAPREQVASSRTITALAARGLPVTSTTARAIVDWIAALEVATMTATAPHRVTRTASRTGWHGTGYLRGMIPHGTAPDLDGATPSVESVCRHVIERGDLDSWRGLLVEWARYPGLRLAIAAAASAPLLRIVGQAPYCVDIAAGTSQGKSSAQYIAASVWGYPGSGDSPGYVTTWNVTRVGAEHLAHGLAGMPLILDDTQRAARPEQCGTIVYDLSSSQGRIRGDRTARANGETVIISSGETPLAEMSGAGGLRARCLTWWGSPVGRVDAEMREVVDGWLRQLRTHHGLAGAALIDHLLSADRAALRVEWEQLREWYAAIVPPGHPVGGRLAGYAATCELGGRCLARSIGASVTEWLDLDTWAAMLQRARGADRASDALSSVWAWATSQPHRLQDSGVALDDRMAVIGRIEAEITGGRPSCVYLLPDPVRAELVRYGYDASACIASWAERGWLDSAKGRTTTTARVRGQPQRVLRLTREAIDHLYRGDTAPAPSTQELPL